MNPRHAAALALVGWYLMVPQPLPNGNVDFKAPLSHWMQAANFDASGDCDRGRAAALTEASQKLDQVKRRLDALPPEVKHSTQPLGQIAPEIYRADVEATQFVLAAAYAQCIATDDPRLKEAK